MRILILETSGMKGEVALADENAVLHCQTLSADRKQARELVPTIDAVLREGGVKAREIDLLLVNIGPGSYTGLRVGIMCATSLAYINRCAILGVQNLAVLAAEAPVDFAAICPAVDAQQGMVYCATFDRNVGDGLPAPKHETQILNADEWSKTLIPGSFVTGPALDRFESVVPAHCVIAQQGQRHPTAKGVWKVGLADYHAGRRDDFWSLEPLYLRSSSAEIRWDRRHPQP